MTTFYFPCKACGGDGERTIITPEGPQTETCSVCGGLGKKSPPNYGMDDTLIQQILTNQAAMIADLDYIHGKVTAIWNAVKKDTAVEATTVKKANVKKV